MRLNFFVASIFAVTQACRLPQIYAQTKDEAAPTCMTTAERARKPVKNFFEAVKGKNRIADLEFGHSDSALFWSDLGEANGTIAKLQQTQNITWARASEAYPKAPLFGDDGASAGDLNEIFTGSSWFVSALAPIAETPGRIEKLFLNTENKQASGGIYAVQLHALGMPMTVMVDDFMPMIKQEDDEKSTFYSLLGDETPLWGAIMEKAFAKKYGNYEHITSGTPSEAIRALTGAPLISYDHREVTAETLWQLISNNDPSDDFIVAGTEKMKADTAAVVPGMAPNHSYSILGTHILKRGGEKLIKLRNPWGLPGFHGTWGAEKWDDASKKETGYKDGKDGIFFIDIATYRNAFTETSVSFNQANWASAKFLKKNDQSQDKNPGQWEGVCGPTCTRHEMSLKSDVDQTVYLTAFTWGRKSIPDVCEKKDNKLQHAVKTSKMSEPSAFSFGDKPLAPFDLKAGETIKVEVEWNFTNEAHAADWSVTAFGDGKKGSLHLTDDKGTKSDSWQPIPRQEPAIKKSAAVVEEAAKPATSAPKVDVESEASFVEWIEGLVHEGADCAMLKEDTVQKGDKQFGRLAIKSTCPGPIAYGISMYTDDWSANMAHAYKNFDIIDCKIVNAADDVQECVVQVTPTKPLTGWQLSEKAYGVQKARKLNEAELEKVKLQAAKKKGKK